MSKLLESIKVENIDYTGEISERLEEIGVTVNDIEGHLSREKERNTWLNSLEWIEEDLIVEGCAVGSEGDPVYNFSTEDILWDIYDLRWEGGGDADFLVVINPKSGKSLKQSIKIKPNKIFGWNSYEGHLSERLVREMSKILLDVMHVLESSGYSFDLSDWEIPHPNSGSLVSNPEIIVESYLRANLESENNINSFEEVEGMIVAKDNDRFRVRFPNCNVICFPIPEDAENKEILVGEYFDI